MTLDKLAEIIERTVAKKEDVDQIKKDTMKMSNTLDDHTVRLDRLESKVDDVQQTLIDQEQVNLQQNVRLKKLESHAKDKTIHCFQ